MGPFGIMNTRRLICISANLNFSIEARMHNRSKTACIRHEWASGGTKQLAEYILIFVIWDLNSAADDDLTRTTALLLPVVPFHPTAVNGATGPLPLPSSHRRPFSHRAESREDTAANKQAACVFELN